MQGFADSDWATERDRKSTAGYILSLGEAALSWASKKQTSVALPTEEAENTVFTKGSREALCIRQPLSYIGLTDSATIIRYADNQSTLKHVRTGGITARTKHFGIRLQHSRDNQNRITTALEYIKSANNTADIFTKALPLPAHQRHLEGLSLNREVRLSPIRC